MLRGHEARFEQYRLAYDRDGFARGRDVGDSTLAMIELIATGGVEAFYQLSGQCEDRQPDGPLPGGATEVYMREVQRTTRYISAKGTECACRLVNRQETAESDLARDSDYEAATQLTKWLREGRFRAS